MPSEDDTFARLKRSSFHEVHKEHVAANLITSSQLNILLDQHCWNAEDYDNALIQHYKTLIKREIKIEDK